MFNSCWLIAKDSGSINKKKRPSLSSQTFFIVWCFPSINVDGIDHVILSNLVILYMSDEIYHHRLLVTDRNVCMHVVCPSLRGLTCCCLPSQWMKRQLNPCDHGEILCSLTLTFTVCLVSFEVCFLGTGRK